jgi:crotonobetainyl-CoA:carnitine CoA-transferase CaiB-like acyl-CoA transferase
VPYQAFGTKDGRILIAALNNTQFKALCDKLGTPALADDPRFSTNPLRVEHRRELVGLLGDVFARETTSHWLGQLEGVLACGPINTIGQALGDAQVLHRGMVQEVDHATAGRIRVVGIPVKMSGTPPAIRAAPPTLGQHTHDVLASVLGYGDTAIETLKAKGVVA